jgi:hypothetical protein
MTDLYRNYMPCQFCRVAVTEVRKEMTIENWLSEVEECKGRNATPIPNCLFTETRLSIGARFGVYIQLLRLVARSPYWRSASVLMPLSKLGEECRLGERQVQRYLVELRQAGWLETRFHGPQGNEYFLKQF